MRKFKILNRYGLQKRTFNIIETHKKPTIHFFSGYCLISYHIYQTTTIKRPLKLLLLLLFRNYYTIGKIEKREFFFWVKFR